MSGLEILCFNWISKIYVNPTAQVKANSALSEPFSIANGTRQRCPLPPLLFALSLEPFLCKIHLHLDITGLEVGGVQQKISAYADDMTFSLTNPSVSLPNLIQEFNIYGALSYLKINFTKSEAMGVKISPSCLQNLWLSFKLNGQILL